MWTFVRRQSSVSAAFTGLLGPAVFRVLAAAFRIAIFCADEFAARLHRLAGAVGTDQGDVRVGFAGAPFLVDDGDLGGFAEQGFGVEFLFLRGRQRAAKPLAQELREGRFFVQLRREAAAPHAVGRAVLAKERSLEDDLECLLRSVGGFDFLERRDIDADGLARVLRAGFKRFAVFGQFHI